MKWSAVADIEKTGMEMYGTKAERIERILELAGIESPRNPFDFQTLRRVRQRLSVDVLTGAGRIIRIPPAGCRVCRKNSLSKSESH